MHSREVQRKMEYFGNQVSLVREWGLKGAFRNGQDGHRHILCVWNYMEEGDAEGAGRGGEMQTALANLRMSRKHPNKLSSYSQIVQVQLSSMCPVSYQALCCLLFLHIHSLKNKQIQHILRISRCLIFPNDKKNMSIILLK